MVNSEVHNMILDAIKTSNHDYEGLINCIKGIQIQYMKMEMEYYKCKLADLKDRIYDMKYMQQCTEKYYNDLETLKQELEDSENSYNENLDYWFLVQEELERK